MPTTQELIDQFNHSPVGRVVNGRESFRNRVGRFMHGLAHRHPKLGFALGTAAFVGGSVVGGPVGSLCTAPFLLQGIYGAITPSKIEKADCDFLMNQAVRKTAAFCTFMERRHVPSAEKEAALEQYLKSQSPMFGYYREYREQNPDAVAQIMSSGQTGDLPLMHGPDLYQAEITQELLTKAHQKGGIVHGLIRSFLPQTRQLEKRAGLMAARRWADRQEWEALPPAERGSWRSFYKDRAFERTKAQNAQLTPKSTVSQEAVAEMRRTPVADIQKNPTIARVVDRELLDSKRKEY